MPSVQAEVISSALSPAATIPGARESKYKEIVERKTIMPIGENNIIKKEIQINKKAKVYKVRKVYNVCNVNNEAYKFLLLLE